jgi:hypothetical protein
MNFNEDWGEILEEFSPKFVLQLLPNGFARKIRFCVYVEILSNVRDF